MDQVQKSSVFSRRIVNLFAGMAYGSPDLPTTLRDGGYMCHSIEQSFGVDPSQTVTPEIILCSDKHEHTLLVEAKSGANLKHHQLARYAKVSPESLVKNAFASSLSSKNHNLLVVGLEQWRDRLLQGSAQVPCNRRVLAITDDIHQNHVSDQQPNANAATSLRGIQIIENQFNNDHLNGAFNPILNVDWDVVPNSFLPVDIESADWEFAEYVMPEIIAALLNEQNTIFLDVVVQTFIRHWKLINPKYQTTLLSKIRHVVQFASQKRFSDYLICGTKGLRRNEVRLSIPKNQAENRRTLRIQLHKKFRDFMNDLRSPQIAFVYED